MVIGNPPYVRQQALGPLKPWLAQRYATYHGVADLYVYFYERGLELLAPDGKLSSIVTNKWLRAGYGEPLRRFFSERAVLEEIIDFGHAPIFEDADTFPCIILLPGRTGGRRGKRLSGGWRLGCYRRIPRPSTTGGDGESIRRHGHRSRARDAAQVSVCPP